jgi:hypothetical protein
MIDTLGISQVKKRGRPKKLANDIVNIVRRENTSLQQLIKGNAQREENEIRTATMKLLQDRMDARPKTVPLKHARDSLGNQIMVASGISGCGRPKKGSQEAKDHMARIRAMKGKK